MLTKQEKTILTSLLNSPTPNTNKHPIYYQENGDLIRENADGTKYKIKLDKNNKEKIIKKL